MHDGIPLPKGWPRRVRSAVVHAVSMANVVFTVTRGQAENHFNARVRLQAENDRLRHEIALLHEELRIKDARMERLPAQRRPHYPPVERLAILELRAARGWSLAQTARRLLVTPLTVTSWNKRLDEEGPDALVQMREPVNRFPEFVGYLVQRLRALCPSMGTRRITRVLARAGLHLGATTLRRVLQPPPKPSPESSRRAESRSVTAKQPEPRLARRPHDGPDVSRILGALASSCARSAVAVLLVGGRCRRSLLQAGHGRHCLRKPALDEAGGGIPRSHPTRYAIHARPSDHGPGEAVRRESIPQVVSPSRHPATIRRHREVRKPGRRRAIHPLPEDGVHAPTRPRSLSTGVLPARALALPPLVQRRPPALAADRQDSRRGLLREIPRL